VTDPPTLTDMLAFSYMGAFVGMVVFAMTLPVWFQVWERRRRQARIVKPEQIARIAAQLRALQREVAEIELEEVEPGKDRAKASA
jgi:hypothetical protein